MPNFSPDAIDQKILEALQADGRITNQELADQVGLSPSPCLRRVRQLETAGIISRYVALVDPEALGLSVSAFVRVRLDQQDDRHLEAFETAVSQFPQVMECYLMTGDSDYLIRVAIADMAALEKFILEQLTPIPGVEKIRSSFALKQVRYKTALPLKQAVSH